MLVRRVYDERLAQACYLIGCERTGLAIVIDPPRDLSAVMDAARAEGVRITHVTETHIHADFVSGTREVAAATGALTCLSAEGGTDWQYEFAAADNARLLHDNDVIQIGSVRLDVWHTPGHTPEHLAFLVTDEARGATPVAMVTGDFLFVGDVGRPDLLEKAAHVAGAMERGARDLFHSIARLASLPDFLQVWPGHGAGSACGKALGALPTSTLGYERQTNWAFAVHDEPAFVASVLEGQPTPPSYFERMKRVNREGPPVLGRRPVPPALRAESLREIEKTATLLDVRPFREYQAAHLVGTLNIPLIRAFTTWAGWLIDPDRDVVLIAMDKGTAGEAQRALASIGLDRIRGWLGSEILAGEIALGRTAAIRTSPLSQAVQLSKAGWRILDLREPDEWASQHLEVAEHHPLGSLRASVAGFSRDLPLGVHCQGGTRSSIGTSVLESMGFTNVINLTGEWPDDG